MFLSHPDYRRLLTISRRNASRGTGRARAGFTFVEMMFSMSILGLTAAVFGGLMMAISTAWDHSTAVEESRRQAQTTLSRVKWMVQQCGIYRVTGQSTTVGLAVAPVTWGSYQAPTALVAWSGGTNGGMNAQGLQTRLPVASEIIVYIPDPAAPARLVEFSFPGNTSAVDFRSAAFASTIQSLLSSTAAQKVLLCDRLHVTASQNSSLPSVANIRFEVALSPSDTQIASVTMGTQPWNDLPWGQGLVGADRGLRTANVRIEMMLDPNPNSPATNGSYSTAVPFFGSVNRQYVFQP